MICFAKLFLKRCDCKLIKVKVQVRALWYVSFFYPKNNDNVVVVCLFFVSKVTGVMELTFEIWRFSSFFFSFLLLSSPFFSFFFSFFFFSTRCSYLFIDRVLVQKPILVLLHPSKRKRRACVHYFRKRLFRMRLFLPRSIQIKTGNLGTKTFKSQTEYETGKQKIQRYPPGYRYTQ